MIGWQGYLLVRAKLMIGWQRYMLGSAKFIKMARHRFAIWKFPLRTSLRLFCFFFEQRLVQWG